MPQPPAGDAIRRLDENLLRSLHALLTEEGVSRAAQRLGQPQPAVSRHLKVLRDLTGDPLLVRAGNRMVLTERAQALVQPVRRILTDLSLITSASTDFAPGEARQHFKLASYDFLPPAFFADIAARLRQAAPDCELTLRGLGERFEHYRLLADGELDALISVWPELPPQLRSTHLLSSPVVCLVRPGHPLLAAPMTLEAYCRADHVASLEHVSGQGAVLDAMLAQEGIEVRTALRTQFLGLVPAIVAQTDLVFTTARILAEGMAAAQGLQILPFPGTIAPLRYNLVWHERTHKHGALTWLRAQIVAAAQALRHPVTASSPSPSP
jgi:DNA-binding transcriptional LysR family regulator